MSTSRRRVDVFEHHRATNTHNKTHTEKLTALETLHTATNTKLDTIATNTANIQIEADAINLNTDELEGKIDTTNTKLNGGLPSALSTAGNLKVSIEESSAGGDATLAEQQSQTALLTTMDVDTGNIASNTSLTNSLLTSVDNKTPTKGQKVMTGSVPVVIASNQSAISVSSTELSSINSNITKGADLTLTEAQQNLVYGVDAFNTSQLEPIRISSDKVMAETFIASVASGITNELPISNAKITQGYDSQVASGGDGLQQTLCYGRDNSGNLDALRTDASGHLEITIDDFVKGNTTASASFPTTDARNKVVDSSFLSNEAISANSFSSTFLDTLGYAKVVIYGEQDSGTIVSNNSLKIMGSNTSGGTYFHIGSLSTQTYISGRTMLIENVPLLYGSHPRYLKIYNDNSSSATITIRAIMSDFNEYQ